MPAIPFLSVVLDANSHRYSDDTFLPPALPPHKLSLIGNAFINECVMRNIIVSSCSDHVIANARGSVRIEEQL